MRRNGVASVSDFLIVPLGTAAIHFATELGAGVNPVTVGGSGRNAEKLRSVVS
jgi:hypothetical protein